jgi:putative oxidoreductase
MESRDLAFFESQSGSGNQIFTDSALVTNPLATYPTLLKEFHGGGMTKFRDLLIDPFARSPISSWSPIPLRLIVGFGFLQHGFAKLSRGPDVFAGILQALAVPAPHFMAWVSILTELLGGLAILLGAFVVLASVPMAVLLLTAIVTVHWPYGFSSIKLMAVTAAGPQFGTPGYEVDLLYLACLAALVVGGSGPLSIDGVISKRWNTKHS